MIKLFRGFAKSLFPQRCAYCGKVVSVQSLVCDDCSRLLPRIKGDVCKACGREKSFCSCRGEKYFVSQAAPFSFESVVRKGLHIFKFRNGQQNAKAYCLEMARTVRERYPNVEFDYVIPVPMTSKSIKKRGYNQVEILSEGVAKNLGLECLGGNLVKLYETEKQHGISYLLRKGNLTGVFDVTDPETVSGKTVLLCDDISTSGETLNECAKMLWLCGAKEIYCISLALTKHHKKK